MIVLRVNDIDIPLREDVNVDITYNVQDVVNLAKKQASYSKTIKVDSSPFLDAYFGFIFDMQSTLGGTTFDPSKKTNAKLIEDDIVLLDGFLRLLSINNDEDKITYSVQVFSQVANIFADMGEDYVSEVIDTLIPEIENNLATLQDTWINNRNYYFAPINYNGNRSNTNAFALQDFKLCWKMKYLFQKIIENYGYTYESTFVDSDVYFDAPFIYQNPINREITQEERENREVIISVNTPQQIDIITTDVSNIDSRRTKGTYRIAGGGGAAFYDCKEGGEIINFVETKDVYGLYNGGYFQPKSSARKYAVNITLNIGAFESSPFGGATYTAINDYRVELWYLRNGTHYKDKTLTYTSATPLNGSETITFTAEWALNAVNKYYFKLICKTNGKPLVIDPFQFATQLTDTVVTPAYVSITSMEIKLSPSGAVFDNSGQPVSYFPNEKLPYVKCKDLFNAMIKMFNLMIDVDKENERKLIIVPYTQFYNQGQVDWSDKLVRNEPIEIIPLSDITAKELTYKYKNSDDAYNVLYRDENTFSYGEANVDILNDFATSKEVVEVPFSLVPPSDFKACGLPFTNIFDKQLQSITSQEAYIGTRQLIATPITINGTAQSYFPAFFDVAGSGASAKSITFQTPKKVYYTGELASSYPANNLFTTYYLPQLVEVTDKRSRLLKCKIALNEFDLFLFNFRKSVLIDNTLYRVNKINYSGNGDFASVELLKVINAVVDTLPSEDLNTGQVIINKVDGGRDIIFAAYREYGIDKIDGGRDITIGTSIINNWTQISGGRS
jgi:hypothetical protein